MKKQLVWITCILVLADCRKYIAPENPYESYKHPNADFIIDPHQLDMRERGTIFSNNAPFIFPAVIVVML